MVASEAAGAGRGARAGGASERTVAGVQEGVRAAAPGAHAAGVLGAAQNLQRLHAALLGTQLLLTY
eukprot:1006202-Prorocentrum_minimum.AAC.1